MGTLSRDTHPDAQRRQIELLRHMPSWRRLELAVQMTQACYSLALTGLKHRHPEASLAELDRRLAAQVLGTELATRAYGPWPDGEVHGTSRSSRGDPDGGAHILESLEVP